jgi:acyl carrier protein
MKEDLLYEVKKIIIYTVGSNVAPDPLTDDYPLLDNLLDSMLVTNLIVALEDNFDFVFNDDELSAEAFVNPLSVAELINTKIGS